MTLEDQIKCVQREWELRMRVYPKWIEKRKMTQAKADAEIEAIEEVLVTLGYVKKLVESLRKAPRLGLVTDDPEGARYIQLSDTVTNIVCDRLAGGRQ